VVLYHVPEPHKITVSAYIYTSHHKHLVIVTAVWAKPQLLRACGVGIVERNFFIYNTVEKYVSWKICSQNLRKKCRESVVPYETAVCRIVEKF